MLQDAPLAMSKRNTVGSRQSRKRRKAGASYATTELDAPDQDEVENIRIWEITRSETNGRVSATRRNHQHSYRSSPELLCEGHPSTTTIEDIAPEDLEESVAKSAKKRKRVRIVKENDSVSFIFSVLVT